MDEKIITIIRWNYLLNWPYVYIRGTKNKGILGFHFLFYLKHIKDMESKDFIGSDLHVQKPIVGHTKNNLAYLCSQNLLSFLMKCTVTPSSWRNKHSLIFGSAYIYELWFPAMWVQFSGVPPFPLPPPHSRPPTLTPPIRLLTVLQVDWNVLSHTVIFWKMIRLSRNYYTIIFMIQYYMAEGNKYFITWAVIVIIYEFVIYIKKINDFQMWSTPIKYDIHVNYIVNKFIWDEIINFYIELMKVCSLGI